MENWINTVIHQWETEGIKLNTGAPTELIREAENTLGIVFPDDFKALYSKMNGFKDLDWQEHMFHFLPIELILSDFPPKKDEDFIGFCDFLLASHYLGYRKGKQGIYKSYSEDDNWLPIAQTLEQLVVMVNSSNDLIY